VKSLVAIALAAGLSLGHPGIFRDRTRSSVLFRVLPGGPSSGQVAAGTLAGSKGEALTTTRASTRTCTKADGTLASLSNNTPCVEASGLVVEPSGTNLVLRSESIDIATWIKYNVTLTANSSDVFDLYGTGHTEERIDFAAITGTNQDTGIYQQVSTVGSGAGAYSASVYARTASGTAQEYVYMQDGTNLKGSTLCTFGTTYTRCCLPNITLAAASNYFHLGNERAVAGGFSAAMGNLPAATLYVEGYQLEKGSTCTSYTPTVATAVTRSADVVSAGSLTIGAAFSLGATATLSALPNDATLVQPYNSSGGTLAQLLVRASDSKVLCNGGGTGAVSSGAITLGTSFRASCSYDGANYTACLNGACSTTAGTAPGATTFTATNLGNGLTGSATNAQGWLHSLCVNSSSGTCL
jgi:hypothetical protein